MRRELSDLVTVVGGTSPAAVLSLAYVIYVGGLAAETLALMIWHASTSQVVAAPLVVQAGTLIVVGGIALHTRP